MVPWLIILTFQLMLMTELSSINGNPLELDISIAVHKEGSEGVIGGERAVNHAYPWQVYLKIPPSRFCGGTIICPRYVMTAFHCVSFKNDTLFPLATIRGIQVIAGVNNYEDPGAEVYSVREAIKHPRAQNNQRIIYYDYALLELDRPIRIQSAASPVYLPLRSEETFEAGTKFALSGWGLVTCLEPIIDGNCGPLSLQTKDLQVLSVDHMPQSYCPGSNPKVEFCAGILACSDASRCPLKGACSGDSGGPLVWLDKTTSEVKLIGVVSKARAIAPVRCGEGGIYAFVPTIVDWINQVTRNCNQLICSQGQCMTRNKLLPQALKMLGAYLPPTPECRTLDQSCDDSGTPDAKCCNIDQATNEKLECKNFKCVKKTEPWCLPDGTSFFCPIQQSPPCERCCSNTVICHYPYCSCVQP